MKSWQTTLNVKIKNGVITSEPIKIARGIFQGDSLSMLWFCLALNPLSSMLNGTGYGYNITGKHSYTLTHLLYVDDLKLYANTKHKLNYLLKTTERYTRDINMAFGLEKCRMSSIVKGKYTIEKSYETEENKIIQYLEQNEMYKYLGYQQKLNIEHKLIKRPL